MKVKSGMSDRGLLLYLCGLVVGFCIVLWASTFHLTETPPIWYDEGIFSQVAENIALHGLTALQTEPGVFVSAWSVNGGFTFLGPIAFSYHLLGPSVLSGRIIMAGFIILFTLLSTLLLYLEFGRPMSLYGLFLIATFPVLYGTGKNILGEVPGLMYLATTLLLLWYIEYRKFCVSHFIWFLYGLCIGLTVITKPIFLPLLGALCIVAIIRWRTIPRTVMPWVAIITGVMIPLGIHAYVHLSSAPLSEIASYYANPYAIEETSLISIILTNALRFATEFSAIYCAVLYISWIIALFIRYRQKDPISASEISAFLFAGFVFLFYLRTVGWYRYFFPGEILALLYFPSSLTTIVKKFPLSIANRHANAIIFASVIALVGLQTYQLTSNSWVADHAQSTTTQDLTQVFTLIPATSTIAFIDTPELVVFSDSRLYSQYMAPTRALLFGTSTLAKAIDGNYEYIVIQNSNTGILNQLEDRYRLFKTISGYTFLSLSQQKNHDR